MKSDRHRMNRRAESMPWASARKEVTLRPGAGPVLVANSRPVGRLHIHPKLPIARDTEPSGAMYTLVVWGEGDCQRCTREKGSSLSLTWRRSSNSHCGRSERYAWKFGGESVLGKGAGGTCGESRRVIAGLKSTGIAPEGRWGSI